MNITIYVRVSNCSGASYENVSSPEYRDLERNLKGNVSMLYKETHFFTKKKENRLRTMPTEQKYKVLKFPPPFA